MVEAEHQPQPNTLPIISSEIANRLIADLNLEDKPIQTHLERPPNETTESLTSEVFSDLINSNKDFAEIVNNVITGRGYSQHDGNATLKGMALVLKAYDHMKEFDLIPRLNSLQPDDINLAKQTLEQSFPPKNQTLTILQQLLTLPRIPEQATHLNYVLGKARKYVGAASPSNFDRGATAMYKTLEVLWPKLYPPQTLPQQPIGIPSA